MNTQEKTDKIFEIVGWRLREFSSNTYGIFDKEEECVYDKMYTDKTDSYDMPDLYENMSLAHEILIWTDMSTDCPYSLWEDLRDYIYRSNIIYRENPHHFWLDEFLRLNGVDIDETSN